MPRLPQTALSRLYGQIRRAFFSSMPDGSRHDTEPRAARILDEEFEAAYSGDTAARSVDEVLLNYPHVLVIIC